jgi:hypothetical protein
MLKRFLQNLLITKRGARFSSQGGSVGGLHRRHCLQTVSEWRVLEEKGRATAVHGHRSDQFSPKYVTNYTSSIL